MELHGDGNMAIVSKEEASASADLNGLYDTYNKTSASADLNGLYETNRKASSNTGPLRRK